MPMLLNIYVPGATARDKSLYAPRLRWVLLAFALAFSAMVQAQNHFYYTFNISGPTTICPGNTDAYTSPYAETIWSVNGGNIVSGGGNQVNIQWTQASGTLSGSFDTQDGGECWFDPETWPPQLLCNPINYNHFTSNHFAVSTGINLYSLAGGTYCAGGGGVNVTLNGSQVGTTYQLRINGSNSGAGVAGTGGTLTWPNQTTAGTYDVMGTRSGCTLLVGSNNVYVTSSVGGTMTGSDTFCNAAGGLVVLANWSGTIMNWERNTGSGWTSFANTANSFNYNNITTTTQYRAWVISGTCAGQYSSIATITVSPTSQGGNISGAGTFCSMASGTLTLSGHTGAVQRWEQNVNNAGWTNINNTTASQGYNNLTAATTQYRALVVSGTCAGAYSSLATVSISPNTVGGSISGAGTFCTSASGWLTLSGHTGSVVRWEQNVNNGGWTVIGNTTASLNYSNVTATTQYRAWVVSGPCGGQYSSIATVTVSPTSQGGNISGAGTFCSTASGTFTLSGHTGAVQRWEQNVNNAGWTNINNTTATQGYSNLTAATTQYRAWVVSGTCAGAYSSVAIVSVSPNTVGGAISGTGTFCSSASGWLTLSGHTGAVQRWEQNVNNAGWTNIANTTASQNYNNVTITTQYRAYVVSGVCGGTYSSITTVAISPTSVGGTITGGSTNESYCKPASGTFTLTGHVGNVLRWEQNYNQGAGWQAIANTASATYNFSNVNQLVSYRAIVKSGVCAEVASNIKYISFLYDPTLGGNLNVIDRYVYASTATGTLNLTGSNGYVPRWEQNTGTGWTAIGSTYNLTSYTYNISQNTSFRAISKNNECAEAISTQANIYLYPAVTISPSTSQWLPYGGSVVLTVNNTYASYQWYRESTPIAGATAQQYTATQPGRYFVEVKGSAAATPATSPVTTVNSVVTYYENTQNAVGQTVVLVEGVTESTSLYTLQTSQLLQSIRYQDGLGRTVQSIGVGQSPQGGDVVSVSAPSRQGLADTTFLPYAVSTSLGTYRPNAIRGSASHTSYTTSEQYLFYQNTAKVAKDNFPFARTLYASDPTLRVTEQGAPGQDWQPSNNKTVRSITALNNATTYRVRYWKPDGTTNSNYPDNSVAVAIATDENGNQVRTYTNALGQTVLKQVQIDDTLEGVVTAWLETYYIYDDFGRLKYQVPPKATKMLSTVDTLTSVAELIYTYTYDPKGRLVEKKVPGAAVEQIVYDNYHRPVMTQDGNQRAQNRWMFVKYDRYNRVVYSGFYARAVTRAVLQGEMDALNYNTQPFFETELVNATTFGYSNTVYPTANLTILAVNYYDHYDFDRNGTPDYTYINNHFAGQEASALANTRNKPTGSRTRVIDAAGTATANWLINCVFYDRYERPIQTRSNNPLYLTVADVQTTVYDFVKVLKIKTSHFQNATTSVVLEDRSDYDRTGRVLRTFRKINTSPEQLLAQYEYNALGQVVDKKLHETAVGNNQFLQSVDYRYTIRGWLKSINNAQLNLNSANNDEATDYFGMELLYNTTETGLNSGANDKVYYNGNIAAVKWKGLGTTGAIDQRSYKYLYDKSDRLKTATFQAHDGTGWARELNTLNENMTYDHNGNIKTLTRNQNSRRLLGATVINDFVTVDNLTYTYANNLDRLTRVEDAVANNVGVGDFKNVNSANSAEYAYGSDGSLTRDDNKGIIVGTSSNGITYNVLGKPRQITFNNNRRLDYFYDAAGNKTKMQVWTGSPLVLTSTTDYVGGFVYENNNLSFFSSPEGRVVKNGANFEYQYAIADHQGNTRLLFTSAPQTAQPVTADFEATTNGNFQNYVNRSGFSLFNRTPLGTTSQLLNGGVNGRVGLAKSYRL
ncbi:MAG: hypothetical protein IM603_04790, partial [Cytophagales bacterium]|nr:hypothetical protein [Cytophagales bacterium]